MQNDCGAVKTRFELSWTDADDQTMPIFSMTTSDVTLVSFTIIIKKNMYLKCIFWFGSLVVQLVLY
jgi:hypothetical protein